MGKREERRPGRAGGGDPETAVPRDRLETLNEQLLQVPEGFTVHPKLLSQLERRRTVLGPDGGIDWALAEGFALGSLVEEGVPVRLSGQDTERGTFAHRHLVLHDVENGDTYAPIQHLPDARRRSRSTTRRSPRPPASASSTATRWRGPEAIVLWEAQFGDFVNGAQIIIDQFIVVRASRSGGRRRG